MQTKPQPDNQIREIECFIYGRVQMVLFRDFAQRNARKLGITGLVENLADSSVHVIAQGTEPTLLRFAELLKQGPMLARVDCADIKWRNPYFVFETFEIRY